MIDLVYLVGGFYVLQLVFHSWAAIAIGQSVEFRTKSKVMAAVGAI